jgi:hypothetical protein
MVQVRRTLSKAGHPYFTFLSEGGCEYLKLYLEYRLRKGEEGKMDTNTPIITAKANTQDGAKVGETISSASISAMIRKSIRMAGFSWRPYVLRRYFDSRMMLAEADGLIIRDFRVFWMGHKGDIEHTYTLNKKLSSDIIEKMRQAYAESAEKHLSAIHFIGGSKDEASASRRKHFLHDAGYNDQEIALLGVPDLAQIRPEKLYELIKNKEKTPPLTIAKGVQKVVRIDQVEQLIAEGWEFLLALPDDEVLMQYGKM